MSAASARAGSARLVAAALLAAAAGCSGDGTGPSARRVTLEAWGDTIGYAIPNGALSSPLAIRAADGATGAAAGDVAVEWRILSGPGASIVAHDSRTDEFGVARVQLAIGADTGTIVLQASAQDIIGARPLLTVRVVLRPVVTTIAPAAGAVGDTIAIYGENLRIDGTPPDVRFGGVRGEVVAMAAGELSVIVPACVTDRDVSLEVGLGGVASEPVPFRTIHTPAPPVQLAVGEARVFRGAELACIRLAAPAGAQYVVASQNAHGAPAPTSPFELLGFLDRPPVTLTAAALPPPQQTRAAHRWEERLRAAQAVWTTSDVTAGRIAAEAAAAAVSRRVPNVGERRNFRVLTPEMTFTSVTAEVVHVSARTVIYQDVDAPIAGLAGGLTQADFAAFGQRFDDPIFATLSDIFGEPSDIDGNDRIMILFTPKVNALTRPGEAGFIAAYFYGCDLVPSSRCAGTNQAEIFYSMVPDPTGTFGKARTRSDVLRTVPGVLAHEFQHMIHFARKGGALDVLWLSEGLAHAAEDVVADVLEARGETAAAAEMRGDNTRRAQDYLQRLATTSLVAEKSPGSLEMRGGAWLLVRYLSGHYGGNELLRRLTVSSASGIANIEQATGRPWDELVGDFGIALYADGRSLPVRPEHEFADLDLPPRIGAEPVRPASFAATGFLASQQIAPTAHGYATLTVPTGGGEALKLALTGPRAGPFGPGAVPQMLVLRIR